MHLLIRRVAWMQCLASTKCMKLSSVWQKERLRKKEAGVSSSWDRHRSTREPCGTTSVWDKRMLLGQDETSDIDISIRISCASYSSKGRRYIICVSMFQHIFLLPKWDLTKHFYAPSHSWSLCNVLRFRREMCKSYPCIKCENSMMGNVCHRLHLMTFSCVTESKSKALLRNTVLWGCQEVVLLPCWFML